MPSGDLDSTIHLIQGGLIILLALGLLVLALGVLTVVAMWRTFSRAAQPGWAALVPLSNVVVLLRVARRSPWWTLLALVPVGFAVALAADPTMPLTDPSRYGLLVLGSAAAGLVVSITAGLGVAEPFGRSEMFGVFALGVFAFVGYPILGFGSAGHEPSRTPPTNPNHPRGGRIGQRVLR